jgi:hypothetical protein
MNGFRKRPLPQEPDELELLACSCGQGWPEGEELSVLNYCIGLVEAELRAQVVGRATEAPDWIKVAAWGLLNGWGSGQAGGGEDAGVPLRGEAGSVGEGCALPGLPTLPGRKPRSLSQRQAGGVAGQEPGSAPGGEVRSGSRDGDTQASTFTPVLKCWRVDLKTFFQDATVTPQELVQRAVRKLSEGPSCPGERWRQEHGVKARPKEDSHTAAGVRQRITRYAQAYRPTAPAEQCRRVASGKLRYGLVPMAQLRKAREKDTPGSAGKAERLSSSGQGHASGSVEGESEGG